jgi:hypothetical protein
MIQGNGVRPGAVTVFQPVVERTSIVYTGFVRQDITFSADKKADIELAREDADSRNTTLHELFRDWLKGDRMPKGQRAGISSADG